MTAGAQETARRFQPERRPGELIIPRLTVTYVPVMFQLGETKMLSSRYTISSTFRLTDAISGQMPVMWQAGRGGTRG